MTNKIPALSKGFYTTESAGGRGCIKIAFESLDDLHAADDELRAVFKSLTVEVKCWPCWSCHAPVTMANRADADGNCPHCEAELDLEDWPVEQQQTQPAPVSVVLPSSSELRALVTEAARDSDLIAGANYFTAAELAANYLLSKVKELNQ